MREYPAETRNLDDVKKANEILTNGTYFWLSRPKMEALKIQCGETSLNSCPISLYYVTKLNSEGYL